MSEKVHEVPESILKELFLAARGTARRDYITSSLADALEFAEKALSPPPKALLPCPFCGGKAEAARLTGAADVLRWWCRCTYCGAETEAELRLQSQAEP